MEQSSKRRGAVGAAMGLQQAPRQPRRGPTPLEVGYISRCLRCSPVRRRCQLVSAHRAAGIIRLQTVLTRGAAAGEGGGGATACQQLIRAALMLEPPRTHRYPNSTHQDQDQDSSYCGDDLGAFFLIWIHFLTQTLAGSISHCSFSMFTKQKE